MDTPARRTAFVATPEHGHRAAASTRLDEALLRRWTEDQSGRPRSLGDGPVFRIDFDPPVLAKFSSVHREPRS